ncbi:MAG: hypothetical protein M1355_02040 [Patescibacteria group bacterium]|nr:hypothetical protein [Patescibacteria group bacterium]
MKKIFLDVDEEITSVIDRLKKVEESEISLVVPKESVLLQSVVNLKLIKREAEKEGKTITLVTSNKVGRILAENVGLATFSGEREAKEERENTSSEIIQETKEKVPIAYNETPNSKGKEPEFKKESLPEGEIVVKEEEINNEEAKAKEQQAEPAKEKPALQNQKKIGFKLPKAGIAAFSFLAIAILGVAGYFYIPRVEITIKVNAQKKAFETDVTVDKAEPDSKIDRGLLHGELVEIKKEDKKSFHSTGTKNIGTKATGIINVRNSFSTTPQTLVAGTRFQTGNLIFRSTANVDVPGYTDPGGGIVPGSMNVSIEADDVGSQYNVGPSAFTIPAFSGTAKQDKITGVSSQAMSGGESREVKIVIQEDFDKARESYSNEAKEKVKKELKEKIKKDYSLPDEATEIVITDASSSPGIGAEGEQFTLTLKIEAMGLSYKESELREAYKKKLNDEAGTRRGVVEDGYDGRKMAFSKVDLKAGTMSINIKSDAYLGAVFDKDSLMNEIIGQTEAKSRQYILGQEGVKDVTFHFWPSFIKRIPRLKNHLNIKTEVVKEEIKNQ